MKSNNNVAPSATSGVPLISKGSTTQPAFGTAVVAGGGTGATTLTGMVLGNGTSAFTTTTFTPISSWTPNLQFGGLSTGITYNVQQGWYMQIDNAVFVNVYLNISNVGTASGAATIGTLPVTSQYTQRAYMGQGSLLLTSGVSGIEAIFPIGGTKIALYEYKLSNVGGSNTQLTNTNFKANSVLVFNSWYVT
jgi:hypothetical protein